MRLALRLGRMGLAFPRMLLGFLRSLDRLSIRDVYKRQMVDSRTNFAKEISALLRETYGSKIKVFTSEIPHSVRAKEISAVPN